MPSPLWLPEDAARAAQVARPCVVAIGNFDGVHLGHQAVIGEVAAQAEARGIAACVLTFDPHPADVLGKGARTKLATVSRRVELLQRAGAERVFVRRFDRAFAAWAPGQFARELLAESLRAKLVMVGADFHFGANREGDRAMLRTLGEELGFEVAVHHIAGDAKGAFSSTRAREAILAGDLAEAAHVLGRKHAVSGVVAHGAKLGRTLGFPTANLADVPEALPPDGVYATLVDEIAPDGTAHALAVGATSIGVRPSVDGAKGRTVEAYLLDFDRDLYGTTLRVHFVARLHEERKYPSLEVLKANIARDVDDVRALTAGLRPAAPGAYG
jgi:riboflavin kinase/FMN adenylyltransferase